MLVRSALRFGVLCTGALSLAGLATGSAWAQASLPLASDQVSFQVRVCLGSAGDDGVDPECESIQGQLPKRLGSLKLQHEQEIALALGQPQQYALPSGSMVYFRPIAIQERKLHMQVAMPDVVNTRVQLVSGRSVILAGVRHREGQLFVELSPRFIAPTLPPTAVAEPQAPRRARSRIPEVRRVGGTRSSGAR